MKLTVATVMLALAAAACGTAAPTTVGTPPPPTDTAPATNDYSTPAADASEQKIDPSAVRVTTCKMTKDDYGGSDVYYGIDATMRATNTTTLTGTLSVEMQYTNSA